MATLSALAIAIDIVDAPFHRINFSALSAADAVGAIPVYAFPAEKMDCEFLSYARVYKLAPVLKTVIAAAAAVNLRRRGTDGAAAVALRVPCVSG